MHSSTTLGIDAGAADRFAHHERAELRGGEIFQRAEELSGRRTDGADDDGFTHHAARVSIRFTTPGPSSVSSRARIVGAERCSSRDHCGLEVSTISVLPSRWTSVARSTADPTAARHANPTLPCESGAPRSSSTSAPGMPLMRGCTTVDLIIGAMTSPTVQFTLASASPRRAELLHAAGFAFDVQPASIDETRRDGEPPALYVRRLAAEKSAAIAGRGRIIVAADTAVVVDDEVLGKPRDDDDAERMIRLLAGRRHQVLTGVSIRQDAFEAGRVIVTDVEFAPMDDADLRWYVASGEGRTKRAPMPFRAWRPASSRGSRALTRTLSGCRSRACSSCSQ